MPDGRGDRIGVAAGVAATLAVAWWAAGRTGDGPHVGAVVLWSLLSALPWTALWLATAAGLGWPLRRWLLDDGAEGASRGATLVQIALGTAALLTLDATLGRLGLLQAGGAWAVPVVGVALLLLQLKGLGASITLRAPSWTLWLAAPALAVLAVATCSAPGWLWASEFGGYDALSYHLQLPKEWHELGRISGLEHNVYSFLPGYVEAAFYHLWCLRGGSLETVYACQLLHAAFAVLAALGTGAIVAPHLGRLAGGTTAALVLGVPWVVVVGSLAYDEMVVTFLLAAGMLASRRATVVGILAAAAVAAKLTAAGFVAVPLGVLLLWRTPRRAWPAAIGGAAAAGVVVLLPYLVGNWLQTGNPVFPFLASTLGAGHWDAEQIRIWNEAHHGAGSAGGNRLVEAWRQLPAYGLGPNPYGVTEPWLPQWHVLPWMAVVAGGIGVASRRRELVQPAVVLAIQVVFWIALTHVRSRFMLPAVVPLAIIVTTGLRTAFARRPALGLGLVAMLGVAPALIFTDERDGAPAALVGGEGDYRELHRLPEGARVVSIGHATPLYLDDVDYQTTWDRGVFSRAIAEPDWIESLRRDGYTHVLIDVTMLDVWERSGWNDPRLTSARLLPELAARATPEAELPGRVILFRLGRTPPDAAAPGPARAAPAGP